MDRDTYFQLVGLLLLGLVVAILVFAPPEFDLNIKGQDFIFQVDNKPCVRK